MHRRAMEASTAGAVNAMAVALHREYAGSTGMTSGSFGFTTCHLFPVNDTSVSLQPPRYGCRSRDVLAKRVLWSFRPCAARCVSGELFGRQVMPF